MTTERADLYWYVPSPGHTILVGVHPFLVDDFIPEDEEIAWAVRKICLNRSGGLLGMRDEHLRQWLHKAMWDDVPDATNW